MIKKKTKNKFEEALLKQLRRAKCDVLYESEKIPYVLARHYLPDFIISTPTGKVYIEAKGYFRPEHKAKMVAVKKQHPELDIRIVFYTARPAYVRWAERHGFKWAEGKVPKEWMDGL